MRLIDADNLIGLCNIMADKCDGIGESIWNQFAETVRWCPTIDAEPVVRCKDCIYFHDYGDGVKNCWGDGGGIFTKDDDFCSHAERKDG